MQSLSSSVRRVASSFKVAEIKSVIEFETKSHFGGEPLVYVVSDQKKALQDLTGAKTLSARHIAALKELGFTFKQKAAPEHVLS